MLTLNDLLHVKTWTIYLSAVILRLVLLVYGEWQDSHLEVKFTDVDYYVFHDAAAFVSLGESPYMRATYRYSPILAWLLVPNIYLHQVWGKVLFVLCDLLASAILQWIVELSGTDQGRSRLAVAVWLLNPLTATVSCRGNAESIMSALVLGCLYLLHKSHVVLAGSLFGLAVHLKIYPIVYTLAILLYIDKKTTQDLFKLLRIGRFHTLLLNQFTTKRFCFFISFLCTFLALTWAMYSLYGFQFLEHTYLYHVTRRDIRHNFSVYFYLLYTNSAQWLGLVTFVTQLSTIAILSCLLYSDLDFCVFILTYVFVTFNKICTSQYFLWYLSIGPVLLQSFKRSSFKGLVKLSALWFLGQGLWLAPAYRLEFLGDNVFLFLWLAGIIFFMANIVIISCCIYYYSSLSLTKSIKEA